MAAPVAPPRKPIAVAGENWRANPFHKRRLGDDAPDRISDWGRDPRAGDAERGREIGRGVWRIAAERLSGEHVSPWKRPHPSKHFTARLHAFSWLNDLAAVGPSAHKRIAELIDEWVHAFGDWDDIAWDPELTAERLFAWLCWGRPAFEYGAPEKRADLMRCVARQARLLVLSESELGDRHLGLIKAGAALVLAASAGLPDADRLYAHGEEMLLEACAKQFFPDGGHLSRSPEALAEALCDLVTALDALPEASPVLREWLGKQANMLRMLRLGDGGLGCFNGGSEGSAASIDAALARAPGDTRSFQFATHSGYQRLEASALRVLMDVGGAPPLAYSERAHAGALGFELSSESERLIVNVGAARELEPAGRQAARATNAHSTLVLADALSASFEERRGKGAPRLVGPTLDDVRRSSDDSGITVQGRHDGYRTQFGLLHRRYLFIDHEGRNLRGIDELIRPMKQKTPTSKTPIPFVARFHLHPDVRAKVVEHQMALLETPGGQRWRLRTDATEIEILRSTYWGGKTVPRDTLQIVLTGAADPMGHGLGPPNRVRWALARSS
ncbi:heparinase II/III family protein [Terricaulis sp.]|uniref:heparinase II/III family protein n=1 Tax=Terricaulis sp. TaxID=2768686 RepID=UPI0037839453